MKFFVPGTPKPAGSKRGFTGKSGRVVMVDSAGQPGKDQRHDIRCAAQDAMEGRKPASGPVKLMLWFYFARPKSHFYTGKNAGMLRTGAPRFHTKTPDCDKLVRQVGDALTGIVYVDDSQIYSLGAIKCYGEPGVSIEIELKGAGNATG